MKLRNSRLLAVAAFVCGGLASAQALAQNAYITNNGMSTVLIGDTVSVIDTATNTVTATINVGIAPAGVAVSPDGSKVYVTTGGGVSVIATANNAVTKITDPSFIGPIGVAVTPDSSKVYVANNAGNTVSVIATATNAVTKITDPSFTSLDGVAVTPDGSKVYVTSFDGNSVSVIATANNAVTKIADTSFNCPVAFGVFIIRPSFAGTPGFSNCVGQSVSGLALRFGGLSAAAAALGFPSVPALQKAVTAFCGG